jgi:hypothetical protein
MRHLPALQTDPLEHRLTRNIPSGAILVACQP